MKTKNDYNLLKHEYGWQTDVEFLKSLTGKKVILVGPATYMMGSNLGKEIDSYDVIVRMNLSCPVPENLHKDIGSRTDVLYHIMIRKQHVKRVPGSFNLHDKSEVLNWKKDGLKWLVLKNDLLSLERRGGDIMGFMEAVKDRVDWTNVSGYKYRKLTSLTRSAPNMGTIAIYHLLMSNLKSLRVVGCDFHTTGYYTGYGGFSEEQAKLGAGGRPCWGQGKDRTRAGGRVHDLKGQLSVLNHIVERDKRLIIDDRLAAVLGVS